MQFREANKEGKSFGLRIALKAAGFKLVAWNERRALKIQVHVIKGRNRCIGQRVPVVPL
jgi:hypothetical protein